MNVLKPHLQTTIRTLLEAGATQREIERVTGISRHTIRTWPKRFAEEVGANCSAVATGSGVHDDVAVRTAPSVHRGAVACEAQRHRDLPGPG